MLRRLTSSSSRAARFAVLGLALFGASSVSTNAHAKPPAEAPGAAEFKLGLEAMKAGDVNGACAHFERAEEQAVKVGYIVNRARCEAKRGHLQLAQQEWKRAQRAVAETKDKRTEEVERGLAAANNDVPHINFTLPHDYPVRVTFNGMPLDESELTAGRDADPGIYLIEVSATNRATYRGRVDVTKAGERLSFVVPDLARLAEAAPPPARTTNASASSTAPVTAPDLLATDNASTGQTQRTVGIALFSAGLLTLGAGTYFAVRAIGQNHDSKDACPGNACLDDASYQTRQDAVKNGNLATYGLIGGGVLTAAGAGVWLLAPRATKIHAAAMTGTGQTGVVVGGAF